MRKPGQGSVEYIMSYSWALVVVILVGVVLWQIGIFSPSGDPTGGATGFGTVRPLDWSCRSSTGEVVVEWANGVGQNIQVTAPGGGCVYDGTTYSSGQTFNMSRTKSAICTYSSVSGCTGLNSGERFESQVTLTWEPVGGGIVHTEGGSVWKAAE